MLRRWVMGLENESARDQRHWSTGAVASTHTTKLSDQQPLSTPAPPLESQSKGSDSRNADFATLLKHSQGALRDYHVPARCRLIAETILNLSFGLGLSCAYVARLEIFTELTGIQRPDVWRILRRLEEDGVIQADTRAGEYTFLPDERTWQFRRRKTNAINVQSAMPQVLARTDDLKAAIAEVQQEVVLRGRPVGEMPTAPPIEEPAKSTPPRARQPTVSSSVDAVGKSPTTYIPGYPVPGLPGDTRSEELGATRVRVGKKPTDTEEYLLGELERLMGKDETNRNGGLWRTRIREDERAMFEALGQLKLNLHHVKKPAAWLTKTYYSERRRSLSKGRGNEVATGKANAH
jgi:hypothetical protein